MTHASSVLSSDLPPSQVTDLPYYVPPLIVEYQQLDTKEQFLVTACVWRAVHLC